MLGSRKVVRRIGGVNDLGALQCREKRGALFQPACKG